MLGDFNPWHHVPNVTLGEAVHKFQSRTDIRASTLDSYATAIKQMMERLSPSAKLSHVSSSDLAPILENGSNKDSTRRQKYLVLNAFFNWCMDKGMVAENPLKGYKPPSRADEKVEFLAPSELLKLNGQYTDIFRLAACTGMRRSEIASLEIGQVNLDRGYIQLGSDTKSGRGRIVPLCDLSTGILVESIGDRGSGFVFVDDSGEPHNPRRFYKNFKKAAKKGRLPESYTFHTLRHTCASWLTLMGYPPLFVRDIMGHSSLAMTERYRHLSPDALVGDMKKKAQKMKDEIEELGFFKRYGS